VVRERVAAMLTEWDICGEAAQPTLLVLTELVVASPADVIERGGWLRWPGSAAASTRCDRRQTSLRSRATAQRSTQF
jgi:hypothetical protein